MALEALRGAQARGLLTAIGVGAYDPAFVLSIVRLSDIDCVLAADGCSLLDRPTPWVLV